MRLPKERPIEKKVKESWGFSGNRKEESRKEKREEKKSPRRGKRTLSWKPEANT